MPSSAIASAACSASLNTVDSRQAATRLSRTGVSPAAAASLVCMSMHQPQPLIWLARSDTSSWMDFGSGDCSMTRAALANRLLNLTASSLSNKLNRASMISSSLDDLDDVALDEQEMPATRRL